MRWVNHHKTSTHRDNNMPKCDNQASCLLDKAIVNLSLTCKPLTSTRYAMRLILSELTSNTNSSKPHRPK